MLNHFNMSLEEFQDANRKRGGSHNDAVGRAETENLQRRKSPKYIKINDKVH
jgi:hypothetical protein